MSTPKERGWGEPGHVPLTTIRRTDGVALTMNSALADLTSMLLDLTELVGYDLRPGECWGYNPRKVAGTNVWSDHAWGTAVDLNAPANGRGGRGDIPDGVVALWQDHGFEWGGRWKNTDPMHMQFSGTPADAAYMTAQLRAFLGGHRTPAPAPRPTTKASNKMFMLHDERNNTVWLIGAGAPKSLGGRPTEYQRLLALGIPVTVDDGLLVDFLRA